MKNKGFTLVEILVVVAIIGLLSSVFVIGLGGVRSRGRDTKRIADLKQMQNAVELYYSRCGHYPGNVDTAGKCTQATPGADWAAFQAVLTNETLGLGVAKIPDDPVSGKHYSYAASGDWLSYILGATLENDKDTALTASAYGEAVPTGWTKVGTFTCADAKDYCVKF